MIVGFNTADSMQKVLNMCCINGIQQESDLYVQNLDVSPYYVYFTDTDTLEVSRMFVYDAYQFIVSQPVVEELRCVTVGKTGRYMYYKDISDNYSRGCVHYGRLADISLPSLKVYRIYDASTTTYYLLVGEYAWELEHNFRRIIGLYYDRESSSVWIHLGGEKRDAVLCEQFTYDKSDLTGHANTLGSTFKASVLKRQLRLGTGVPQPIA